MINYKELERKLHSMSAHDIIMSMVKGLRNPKTKVDMQTFGDMKGVICYGCAATNAVLHIMDANEEEVKSHVASVDHDHSPLYEFECAINNLRRGRLDWYNGYVAPLGFPHITPIPGQELPVLNNDYTEEQLQEYVKLAEYNKIKEA